MSRDQTANALLVASYVIAAPNLVLIVPIFDLAGAGGELALLTSWIIMLVGCFVASWKRGLFALPSALLALALPVSFLIAMAFGGGLS